MTQEEINKDLGSYITEKNKNEPFWKKIRFTKKHGAYDEDIKADEVQGEVIRENIKEDIERTAAKEEEKIVPQDKEELSQMEAKLEEVNEIEEKVEEKIHEEREGVLSRFFKKLNFSKKRTDSKEDVNAQVTQEPHTHDEKSNSDHQEEYEELKMDDPQLREMLHGLHHWLTQLPPEKLEEFKASKDFEVYAKFLRKHEMIR